MVYTMAENSWLSQLWLDAPRCVYALERDSNRGSTPTVFIELPEEIGLEQMDEDVHRVFFCNTELGEFNSAEMRFRPAIRT